MIDNERVRKAIEVIIEENGLDIEKPAKLYATRKQMPEIETGNGLFKIRMDYEGRVEIESLLGPKVSIIPVHTNETTKVLCPKGAIYEITTSAKEEGIDCVQSGVCYVDARGLVIYSERNIRINSERNQKI